MKLVIGEEVDDSVLRAVVAGLDATSDPIAPRRYRPLSVLAYEGEQLAGGAIGNSYWDWVHVKYLWVAETFRRQGLGRQLMQGVESEARARGCMGVHLNTFDFQAVDFYRKLGYEVFGQIDDHPRGHTRYYMLKRF